MRVNGERNTSTHRTATIAGVVFAAAAAYLLLTEHRAHAVQALPWVLFAACPLMHVFMHRGHHSPQGAHPRRPEDEAQ